MKRNTFIQMFIATGAYLSFPFTSLARGAAKIREKKGYKVDAGKGRAEKPMTLF